MSQHAKHSAKRRAAAKPAIKQARGRDVKRDIPLTEYMDSNGAISIKRVMNGLRMSTGQFAETAGLSPEALYKTSRAKAAKTQHRVLEVLEILNRVSGWAGGKEQAMAWYRAEPIPALGDRTAESLVKSGAASTVRDYLDMIATGGYA